MNYTELAAGFVEKLGGTGNIIDAKNCMTRLRITVKDPSAVDDDAISAMKDVKMLIHDEPTYVQIVLGPGKARDVMEALREQMSAQAKNNGSLLAKGRAATGKTGGGLRVIADIFTPMIPAMIAAGIAGGLAKLIDVGVAHNILSDGTVIQVIQLIFTLISDGFLAYLTIFTGINSAIQFGLNPILGGVIGGASIDGAVNKIAELLGWYDQSKPANSILSSGAGGIIGVILGVWVLAKVEQWIHKRMPASLDMTFTGLLALMVVMPLYVLVIMPLSGLLATGIASVISAVVESGNVLVTGLAGFLLATLFLPIVLLGLHRGLMPIYALQIEETGATALFPAVAMAGAGQVGAAIALYIKARRVNNQKMKRVIAGAIPAGVLGIGEPLIYGVTLPLGKPFITAGLGAGFGGAWIMMRHVMTDAYAPSGILGVTITLSDKMVDYLIGFLISIVMGAIITWFFIPDTALTDPKG